MRSESQVQAKKEGGGKDNEWSLATKGLEGMAGSRRLGQG